LIWKFNSTSLLKITEINLEKGLKEGQIGKNIAPPLLNLITLI
jgi:hypothetical protein